MSCRIKHNHSINATITNVLLQRIGSVVQSVHGVKCVQVKDGGNLNLAYKSEVYTE